MTPAPPLPDAYLQWCEARKLTPLPNIELRQRHLAALRRYEAPAFDDAAILRALRARHVAAPLPGAVALPPDDTPDRVVTRTDDLDDAEIDRIRRSKGVAPSRHAQRMGVPLAAVLAARHGEGPYKDRGFVPPVPRAKGRPSLLAAEEVDEIRRNAHLDDETHAARLGVSAATIALARSGGQGYAKVGTVPPVRRPRTVAVVALKAAQVDQLRQARESTGALAERLGLSAAVVGDARVGRGVYAKIGSVPPCPDIYPPTLIAEYDRLPPTLPLAAVAGALSIDLRAAQGLRVSAASRARRAAKATRPKEPTP